MRFFLADGEHDLMSWPEEVSSEKSNRVDSTTLQIPVRTDPHLSSEIAGGSASPQDC